MKKYLFSILCLALLNSCVQTQIIDEQNIQTGLGFDIVDEKKIRGTILYPQYLPDKSVQNNTLAASAKVSRDLLSKLERKSNKPIITGSLLVTLFSKELAERGFFNLIDSLERDPNIGSRVYLAIVDGDAKDLMEGKYGSEGNSVYISNQLMHNMKKRDVPRQNLHVFGEYYYQKGTTTFLPIIKQLNQNRIEITGLGFFDDKHLVQTIGVDKMFYMKILVDRYSQGNQMVRVDGDEIVIRSLNTKSKVKVDKNKTPLQVSVDIKIEGVIREYTGEKINKKKIEEFEKKFEKKTRIETLKLLKGFQELNIDPVGIAEHVKSKTRNFDWKKWEDQYKTITFKINPKINIIESGTVD